MSVSALKNYIFMMPTVPYTAKLKLTNTYIGISSVRVGRFFPPIFNLC